MYYVSTSIPLMALLAATLFSRAAARSRRQDALWYQTTHAHNLPQEHPDMRQNADTHRLSRTRLPNVPQEPCSGNCTEPSHSMGAACHPMGILSCNHTSAAAPLTDSIKIMQPTHTLLYWKTRSVGGVGWQVYWNQTRGRNYSPSRKPHSLFLIDGHRAHYGHRHNTRSDVNVIS